MALHDDIEGAKPSPQQVFRRRVFFSTANHLGIVARMFVRLFRFADDNTHRMAAAASARAAVTRVAVVRHAASRRGGRAHNLRPHLSIAGVAVLIQRQLAGAIGPGAAAGAAKLGIAQLVPDFNRSQKAAATLELTLANGLRIGLSAQTEERPMALLVAAELSPALAARGRTLDTCHDNHSAVHIAVGLLFVCRQYNYCSGKINNE